MVMPFRLPGKMLRGLVSLPELLVSACPVEILRLQMLPASNAKGPLQVPGGVFA